MNKVDSLLKSPFSSLGLEQKLQIKRLGAHQPSNFTFSQTDGKKKRNFSNSWFEKKAWLTVSEEKQTLFCFYCLLFGGRGLWTTSGFKDLKHLSEQIKKHEECIPHLESAFKFKTFGTVNIAAEIDSVAKISVQKHNEKVTKNRHILNRVIDSLKFCGTHELALKGHSECKESTNRGNFLDLLSLLGNHDTVLNDHLNSAPVCNYTSEIIQNELLDCMYEVYIEELKKDISAIDFVALQANEITDISCCSQFVIILRFIKDCKPVERFLTFEEVHDHTATGLSKILKKSLQPFKLENKLIAQAYDGALVMNGTQGGVQTALQDIFPHAKYVHCYAHQLSLLIMSACSKNIKSVKLFFANVSGFATFFSSPKHSDLLHLVNNEHIPTASVTQWDFQSRVVQSVKENKRELLECFDKIEEEDGWDDITVREAFGLKRLLSSPEFMFFLNFFYDILQHVDDLYTMLQMQCADSVIKSSALQHFESAVFEIQKNIDRYIENDEVIYSFAPIKRCKRELEVDLTADAKEVCDIVTSHLKEHFQQSQIFDSFAIIDPKKFTFFKTHFPCNLIRTFSSSYSTFISKEKLTSELSVMYRNDIFKNLSSVCDLYNSFTQYSFEDSFSEVWKTLQIVLTTPVTTAESEWCFNTLKRAKTYLQNSVGQDQDRLNFLAICSIHKEEIAEISNFNNRVIEKFANQKNRNAQFLYK